MVWHQKQKGHGDDVEMSVGDCYYGCDDDDDVEHFW